VWVLALANAIFAAADVRVRDDGNGIAASVFEVRLQLIPRRTAK